MNPDEKTENDPAVESTTGGQEGEHAAEESGLAVEEPEPGTTAGSTGGQESDPAAEESAIVLLDPEEAGEAEATGGGPAPGAGEREGPEGAGRQGDASRLKPILEALIFVSEQPVSIDRMAGVLPDCPRKKLREVLAELERDYEERGGALEIVQVANGYQFRTRAEFAPWLGRLRRQKFARLSRAALETLAIVAYRQPVTRAEAEAIRGVDSGGVLGTLLERRLLRILGRKEVPGRPILYGTTQEFLELFGLKSLKDLPTLKEMKDMVEEAAAEGAEGPEGPEETEGRPEAEGGSAEGGEEGAKAGGPGEAAADAAAGDGKDPGGEDDEGADDDHSGAEDDDSDDDDLFDDEEITAGELDEILKSTKTRLELYEADLEVEEEADGKEGEQAQGQGPGDEGGKAGEGEKPDEG